MGTANSQRIVIRRRKHGGAEHHGGSWKIAYADFVTAMMAFFLVMWLVGLMPEDKRRGIAEFFRQPLVVPVMPGADATQNTSPIPGGGMDVVRQDGDVRRSQGERLPRGTVSADAQRREQRRLEGMKRRLDSLIESSPVLKAFQPQLLLDITTEGLRVQIVDTQNRPMFANGRATVEPHMRAILRELAPVINEMPNRLSISGHTDATQYAHGERAYSNWELSADRANASRKELVAGGLHEGKVMRVMGMSSSMSLVKDDPYAAVNRRISLIVLNAQTQRRIEQENAAAATTGADLSHDALHAFDPIRVLHEVQRHDAPTHDAGTGEAASVRRAVTHATHATQESS